MSDRVDELFAQVAAPAPLSDVAVARIASRLRKPQVGSRRKIVLVFVGAALLVNAALAAVAAKRFAAPQSPSQVQVPVVAPKLLPVPRRAVEAVEVEAPPAPATPVVVAPKVKVSPVSVPMVVAPAAAPVAVSPASTLAEEAAALAPAIQALNQRDDAAAALDALTAYRTRFPHGELQQEAAQLELRAQRLLDEP